MHTNPSIPDTDLFAFALSQSRRQAHTCAARNALTRARAAYEWLSPVLKHAGIDVPSIRARTEDLRAALDVLDVELPADEEFGGTL